MKFIYMLIVAMLMIGCDAIEVQDINVTPKFGTLVVEAKTYRVFDGYVDDVEKRFEYGAGNYVCNAADLLVYTFDDNLAYVGNTDLSMSSCTTKVYDLIISKEGDPTIEVISKVQIIQ